MVLQPIFWDLRGFDCLPDGFSGQVFAQRYRRRVGRAQPLQGAFSCLCQALPRCEQLLVPSSGTGSPRGLPGMSHKQGPRRKGELWTRNLDRSG